MLSHEAAMRQMKRGGTTWESFFDAEMDAVATRLVMRQMKLPPTALRPRFFTILRSLSDLRY